MNEHRKRGWVLTTQIAATSGKDRQVQSSARDTELCGIPFLIEQEVTFFLSFLYAPGCSLPSLNCNECAVNLFTNWGQRGYQEIYVITASTEAREQFLGLRRGRVLFNTVYGWTSPGDDDV